jgi:hypothetical protein
MSAALTVILADWWLIYVAAIAVVFGAWYPLYVRLCDGSRELDASRITGADASPAAEDDTSAPAAGDASSRTLRDASRMVLLEAEVGQLSCKIEYLRDILAGAYRAEKLPVPEELRPAGRSPELYLAARDGCLVSGLRAWPVRVRGPPGAIGPGSLSPGARHVRLRDHQRLGAPAVDITRQPRGWVTLPEAGSRVPSVLGDECPVARVGHDQALGLQQHQRLLHGDLSHAVLRGQAQHRGETGARRQLPAADLLAQDLRELHVGRHRPGAVDHGIVMPALPCGYKRRSAIA